MPVAPVFWWLRQGDGSRGREEPIFEAPHLPGGVGGAVCVLFGLNEIRSNSSVALAMFKLAWLCWAHRTFW